MAKQRMSGEVKYKPVVHSWYYVLEWVAICMSQRVMLPSQHPIDLSGYPGILDRGKLGWFVSLVFVSSTAGKCFRCASSWWSSRWNECGMSSECSLTNAKKEKKQRKKKRRKCYNDARVWKRRGESKKELLPRITEIQWHETTWRSAWCGVALK